MMLCTVESTWCQSSDGSGNELRDVTVCTITGSNEALSCRPVSGGVTLVQPENKTPLPCTLHFSVSTQSIERALISSVDVLCDAKNAEIFGNHEEYIATSRGTRVDDELGLDSKLYILQHSFDSLMARCMIRLLSHADPCQVWIHSIYITLERSPGTTNTLTSPTMELLPPTIDVDKVKAMLSELDQELPERAKSLLAAMETFQKNKASTLASTMAAQVSSPSSGFPEQVTALMSMLTSMQMATPPSKCSEPGHLHDKPSVQQAAEPGDVQQGVSPNETNRPACPHCSSSTKSPSHPGSSPSHTINSLEMISHLEYKFHAALEEAEARIMDKIHAEMSSFEERINAKLDMILSRLSVTSTVSEKDETADTTKDMNTEGDDQLVESGVYSTL